jgi:hypothetical protein
VVANPIFCKDYLHCNNQTFTMLMFFLHRQDIEWSRSYVPVLMWSYELRRTTRHTIVYPVSGPFYKIIVLHPALLCIEDEQCYNGGELRAREVR